jgi:hypothetical protein
MVNLVTLDDYQLSLVLQSLANQVAIGTDVEIDNDLIALIDNIEAQTKESDHGHLQTL